MNKLLILFITVVPVFLIGFYIYSKDKDKESKKIIVKLFFLGVLSCFPTIIISMILSIFWNSPDSEHLVELFFFVLIKIALVEELCKWFMVYTGSYNSKDFDQIYDAIVYSVAVSLGFAAFENFIYVFDGGIQTGLIRAFTAIPCHAINAIIMGNYLGLAKKQEVNKENKLSKKYKILSILMPTIAHAIYDYCLYSERMFFLALFIIYVIFIYIYGIIKVKKIAKNDKNINDETNTQKEYENINLERISSYLENHCPVCGNITNEKKCNRCGADLSN